MRPAEPHIRRFLLALFAPLALAGCDDDNPNGPKLLEMAQNTFVFQRADSTMISMGNARTVCCGIFDPGVIDEPSIKIVTYDPSHDRSEWELYIFTDVAVQDTTYSLPLAPLGPNPPPVYIVVVDRSNGNVTNSSVADASGTITLHSYSCAGAIHMYVTMDAVVGDTNAADQMRVQGSFQGTYPAKTCN